MVQEATSGIVLLLRVNEYTSLGDQMLPLLISVEGEPVAQPRHRAGKIRFGKRAGSSVMFLPSGHPVRVWKDWIRYCATLAAKGHEDFVGGKVLDGPISVTCLFVCSGKKSKQTRKSDSLKRKHKTTKPDLDNLLKAVLDALNGWLWNDDSQVVYSRAAKVLCKPIETPRAVIVVGREERGANDVVKDLFDGFLPSYLSDD